MRAPSSRPAVMSGVMVLAAALASGAEQPQDCLKYEPELVTLHGTIERQSFPGPPNYESVKDGDALEIYWFLRLDQPLCVVGTDDPYNPAQAEVERVQLVFKGPDAYKRYRALMGRKAIATGTLYGAQTAHHKTPLLISVVDLAAAARKLR